MDLDDFQTILDAAGVDIWTLIDTAVLAASLDYGQELKQRRDGIVEKLYGSSMVGRCRTCDNGEKNEVKVETKTENGGAVNGRGGGSPPTPPSADRNDDDEQVDPFGGLFEDEPKSVLEIKELLEDHDQPEDTLVHLLQSLADMDITFQALQETDIGRHVYRLRKHSSNDVRRLVKQLVRKWKEIVDEWVMVNQTGEPVSSPADRDSSQQKLSQNGDHRQIPDFGYSPNLNNGMSPYQERNKSERDEKPRPIPPPRKELIPPAAKASKSSPLHNVQRQQKESFDADRLASARKRLQDNYKEAENAKKQRTIQVINELPKPKKAFAKGKPNGASHARQW